MPESPADKALFDQSKTRMPLNGIANHVSIHRKFWCKGLGKFIDMRCMEFDDDVDIPRRSRLGVVVEGHGAA